MNKNIIHLRMNKKMNEWKISRKSYILLAFFVLTN